MDEQLVRPVDPSTGSPLEPIAVTPLSSLDDLVTRAAAGLRASDWARNGRRRAAAMLAWADALEAQEHDLVAELIQQTGKIRPEAVSEVRGAIESLRYNAGMARYIGGRAGSLPDGSILHLEREPVGPTLFIVPWNWPILLLLRDLAPGLAAGVTAIVKPAPQTSPVTEHVVRLGREAGLDGGILQLAIGGPELGRALVEHPGIRAVAFTGSTETGAQIMAAGSTTLKRMLLELGGKGSSVIMEDADVPSAVEASVRAAMTTTGQMCMACSRIIAHRSRFAAVLETVIEMLRGMTVGPPGADGSDLGPLISSGHRDRVLGYVDLARRTCQVAWGGEPAHVDGYPGWFMTPAVVTGADPSSPLIQDEIFGPVVSVERFDTLEEAVALANASRYGLTAAVWTDDAEQGWDAARSIEAGTVWVNGYGPSFPEVPSGGFKGSGSGRTRGIEGIEQFTEIKSINWKLPRRRPPA